MHRKHKLVATAAVAALAVALAACSSSSHAPSGQNATTSNSSHATPNGTPIDVGLMCTCSGVIGSAFAPAAKAYQAWANTVNDSGGINGHPVHVTTKDDAGTPGTAVTDVQGLLSDHVDAVVDLTVTDSVWASAVQKANVPVVGGTLASQLMYTNPDFYPAGQTVDSSTYAIVATAKMAGATNLGLFYCAEAVTCAQLVPGIKSIAQKMNLHIPYTASISATAPNYTAQCVAAQQAHTDGLIIEDSRSEIANVGRSCDQQSYKPHYVILGQGFANELATTPGIKDDLWSEYTNTPFWEDTPAIKTMNAAVDKYYPGLTQDPTAWSEVSVQAWAAGLLLADAIKAGGLDANEAPSPAEVIKGLHSLKDDTLDGLSPPLTFGSGTHTVDCWYTARMQGGVSNLVNGGTPSCERSSK